jgi:tRNA (mo5U34)-methyltransferase
LKQIDPDSAITAADIQHYYNALLNRETDPEGLSYYLERAQEGLSQYDLYRALLHSEEWQSLPVEHRHDARVRHMSAFGFTEKLLSELSWFHSVELPDGTITSGYKSHEGLCREADIVFRDDPGNKTVLDIGSWDGFFSFEAERRHAKSVLSTDHFSWSGPGWGSKAGYDLLHCALESKAESLDVDVFELDPEQLGTFDVVLFLGVLYHLKDPFAGLEKATSMSHDLLVVETETTHNYTDEPLMRYYIGGEMNDDDTNYWAPNLACLQAMLRDLGFNRFDITPNYGYEHTHSADEGDRLFRYFMHARR